MELSCYYELTGVDKIVVWCAIAFGLILITLGVIRFFRRAGPEPEESAKGEYKDTKISLPLTLAYIVLGIVLLCGAGWWFNKSLKPKRISFLQKPWTLIEIKERIESVSRLRVDLKDEAKSFSIDKDFSGACALDLLETICQYYSPKLECDHDSESRTFVIEMQP